MWKPNVHLLTCLTCKFGDIILQQTTGLLIIKIPVELFFFFFLPMCAVFVKKKKKSDLEVSHLYFKFPSQHVATATKVAIWEKTDVFASIRMQSLEKGKRKKAMKIHHFIIQNVNCSQLAMSHSSYPQYPSTYIQVPQYCNTSFPLIK